MINKESPKISRSVRATQLRRFSGYQRWTTWVSQLTKTCSQLQVIFFAFIKSRRLRPTSTRCRVIRLNLETRQNITNQFQVSTGTNTIKTLSLLHRSIARWQFGTSKKNKSQLNWLLMTRLSMISASLSKKQFSQRLVKMGLRVYSTRESWVIQLSSSRLRRANRSSEWPGTRRTSTCLQSLQSMTVTSSCLTRGSQTKTSTLSVTRTRKSTQ